MKLSMKQSIIKKWLSMMARNNAFRKINRWDVIVFYYCTGSNLEADPFLRRPDYQALAHLSFHNSTYDFITSCETCDFIVFLTKSWGLEKNIELCCLFWFVGTIFFFNPQLMLVFDISCFFNEFIIERRSQFFLPFKITDKCFLISCKH